MKIDDIIWTIAGLFLCGMWIYSIGILFVLLIANPPLILGLSLFLTFLVWLFRIEYENMEDGHTSEDVLERLLNI